MFTAFLLEALLALVALTTVSAEPHQSETFIAVHTAQPVLAGLVLQTVLALALLAVVLANTRA